jgi:branched-chain amino acid aminotransferase group I
MEYKIFINGRFLTSSEAKIPIQDVGFLFGWGLFETMRSYKGFIYKLSEHVRRLTSSARFFKISLPYSEEKIARIVQQTLNANNLQDAYIKLILSGGVYSGKFSQPCTKSNLIVIAQPFTPFPKDFYSEGIGATLASIRRNCASPIYQHKTLNFLENLLAKKEAEEKGYQEAIFLNTRGYLAEGCTTNLFLLKEGEVITPSLDSAILPGITRQVVLELCSRTGIPSREKEVSLEELYQADEAFLTNSLREIIPLTRIDSKLIGKGKPGRITRLLMKEYKYEVRNQSYWANLSRYP